MWDPELFKTPFHELWIPAFAGMTLLGLSLNIGIWNLEFGILCYYSGLWEWLVFFLHC